MDKKLRMPDTKPPAVPEIEASILGGILIDKEAMSKVAQLLSVEKFYLKEHNVIYAVMLNLFEKDAPIDTVTLYDELKKRKQLEEVGGAVYLSKLSQNISSAANIEYHAKIVYDKFILRELINTAHQIAGKAYQDEDSFEIIEEAEKKIFDLTQIKFKKYISTKEAILRFIDKLEKKTESFIGTGFYDLDKVLHINKSDLIILAARPSIGKTSLALNILKYVCKTKPCGFFSLEMSNEAISGRLLSSESGLTFSQIIDKYNTSQITASAHKVMDYNIFLDDTAAINLVELRSKARRMKIEQNIEFLVIDYLQLMKAKAESREREIGEIAEGLKAIAKDLNIPVLALSQLNRKAEDRVDKKPSLADLRESGALEQAADSVLLIHRPEYYNIDKLDDGSNAEGKAILIVAKQRNGQTSEVTLGFKKETTTFFNLATENVENVGIYSDESNKDLPF
jgi:replicative DNA helicase